MKIFSSFLAVVTSSCGLLTLNLAISLPAQASVVCETDTITKYGNGSLASCILSQDMNLQISSYKTGTSNFVCKSENYISFSEKGQFASCILAAEMKIIKGNAVETCLPQYQVNVVSAEDGSLAISCKSLRLSSFNL
ncbi:hypothetical protein H6G33_12905 [Calothrix sp. FACHB-1219]|uniref:hypothetical protein n=1 Tax=unclassified Calothrix TaxID=2619626 RepID=UPI00168433BC|nr:MULTISPECIES: hypothetical protein [unclassified Calothrix]MBD2202477.1 hypothetical protein [Calothrix sp. FACHB-168]MBD2217932.1 hypothetical protein [Calothrix sp. FACHB-1219]